MTSDVRKKIMGEETVKYSPLTTPGCPYKLGPLIKGSTNLFKGLFNEKIHIALKKYEAEDKDTIEYQRNWEFLSSPENRHPNLIRYFGYAVDDKLCKYLAVELCEYSVAGIIPKKGSPQNLSEVEVESIFNRISHKEILRQSSEAVSFLHGLEIIHRNIHPENFLLFRVDSNTSNFLIKLTDFKLSKIIEKIPTSSSTKSPTKNNKGWVAQEMSLNVHRNITKQVDAFLMGCYYYYVLSKGSHPFGDDIDPAELESRIENKDHEVYKSSWNGGSVWNDAVTSTIIHEEEATWALNMIKSLTKFEESERKSVEDVLLKEPYFQPETYQIYGHLEAKKPGLCVIVTQAKYHNPAFDCSWEDYSGGTYPSGVNIDANNLGRTFRSFGYDVLSFKNLRADEIRSYLSPKKLLEMIDTQEKKAAGSSSFKNYASLVVCLLGHGNQGNFIGVDGIPVSLNSVQYDAFGDNACPDLKGKPKVFIILACQGENVQKDPLVSGPTFPMATSTTASANERSPPVFDFIRLVSTIEGYKTFGDWRNGTPFINSLYRALDDEYKDILVNTKKEEFEKEEKRILKKSLGKRDLTQLFTTFVTPLVGRTIQTPEFRSSLSKTIRFRRIMGDPITVPKTAYDGEKEIHFEHARKYYISLGWKAKKIISDSDCNALYNTLVLEAPDRDVMVWKAIAWVILNRYNSNFECWGGNKSLEKVCKHPGDDQFNCWKIPFPNLVNLDKNNLDKFHNWLISVYGELDTSQEATNYYVNDQVSGRNREDLEPTIVISVIVTPVVNKKYHFYKLSNVAKERIDNPQKQNVTSRSKRSCPDNDHQPSKKKKETR